MFNMFRRKEDTTVRNPPKRLTVWRKSGDHHEVLEIVTGIAAAERVMSKYVLQAVQNNESVKLYTQVA